MENNKKESKFFKMAEEFEEVYGVKAPKKTKNIRKHKVQGLNEIRETLKIESPKLAEFFDETCKKINNDVLVKLFWDMLIKCEKYNKPELSIEMCKSALLTVGTSQVLKANNTPIAAAIVGLLGLGLSCGAVAREVFSEKNAKIFSDKDKLIICEPELYDIELVFNGYTRDMIDTSEYDGKAEYQKLHNEYSPKELYKTKLQHDLESDEDKAM